MDSPKPPALRPHVLLALALGLALAVGSGAVAGADSLLTLKTQQEAYQMAGRDVPAQETTVEMWIGDGRVSRDDGKNTVILRTEPDELYVINHDERSFARIELPFDFASTIPEGMEEMAAQWKMTAEVTASDETKTVGEWSARRYDISMSNPMGLAVELVMWASKDLEIDYDTFNKLSLNLLGMQPGGEEMAEELAEIEGYPVLQETTVNMGDTTYTTREELVSAEEKTPPAGTYEVPDGYSEKDLSKMAGGGPGGR